MTGRRIPCVGAIIHDDAAAARWVAPADVTSLPLTTGLAEALRAWGVLDPE